MARVRAPELLGQGGWIGAVETFGLAALSGKIVVLDFFTSSCVNCIRVQAELREIKEKFTSEVVVVGVHSPKFPREHEHDAVVHAVERLGITHAVLDDPDLSTWQQYGVKGWPTLVVIDPEGYIVGGISGEGSGPVVISTIEAVIAEHEPRGTLNRAPVIGTWDTHGMSGGFRTLSYPGKVAVDPSGRRMAISDTGNNRVVVADIQGRVEQVYPLLTRPQGVIFDGDRLVVCDTGADRVVAIDRASGQQTTLADTLASPWDVAKLPDGSLLIAEAGRHRLWRIPTEGAPYVAAGTGQENLIDSPALLAQPSGVAPFQAGAIFVDAESSALRTIGADGAVTTLVGQGLFDWGASDGGPESAAMQHPLGVDVAADGVVYIADTLNSRIRSWDDDGLHTLPVRGLDEPGGIAVLHDGRVLIADTNHHRVVVVRVDSADAEPVALDESWLGTTSGDPIIVGPDEPLLVPFDFDPGVFSLDSSGGPPVRIEVSAEPATLLAAGPRSWALAEASGTLSLQPGHSGEGLLVVSLEVSVCDDDTCTVLRHRARHDLTVGGTVE